MNKVFGLRIFVLGLCVFFTAMHAVDAQAMVMVKAAPDRTVFVPLSIIRDYVARIPFFALEHETLFVHNYLRTQKRIPKVNNIVVDAVDEKKALVCYVPQGINRRVIHDKGDDPEIRIDLVPDHTFLSEQDFEYISRMPEGAPLCFCNALFGAAMLGGLLILTFCR